MVRSIILAAGSSTRMGQPKALLEFGRLTFLGLILRNHQALGLPVTIVLGEHEPQIRARLDLSAATVLVNPHPELGPLSSLKIGLESCEPCRAVLVHPVDHPLVLPATLEAVLQGERTSPDRIIVPRFGARRGHPVLFPRLFFEELIAAPHDQGARYVVRKHQESVSTVEVQDEGIIKNIDTPEDYDRLIRRARGN